MTTKTYLWEWGNKMKNFRDNMPIKEQIDILAKFLMDEFGTEMGNKGQGEGAIEMSIRLLNEYKYRDGVIGKTPDGKIIN